MKPLSILFALAALICGHDLKTDRAEQHGLAAKFPEKVKELEAAWQSQTDRFIELARKPGSE